MIIRPTTEHDWEALRSIRLAALLDAPTAFGVSYQTAALQTEAQWRERAAAAPRAGGKTEFWLAFDVAAETAGDARADDTTGAGTGAGAAGVAAQPVGMIGAGVDGGGHYNLIGMWVALERRGSEAARRLVDAVKARAIALGHPRIVLDVAPENARAARFYRKQGFVFLDEWEPLASHPDIRVRKMEWRAQSWANP